MSSVVTEQPRPHHVIKAPNLGQTEGTLKKKQTISHICTDALLMVFHPPPSQRQPFCARGQTPDHSNLGRGQGRAARGPVTNDGK